ncbi:hypothetical protein SAMN05444161_8204 [Rhizobiales bacterium GAS191]|jgi:hypothetical protein|nr:hypothetical protein SAMN05519103_07503 [Rhizobiales bacterium GAS113]SED31356.1 hypothetical protein SAMN05519104_3285 [Rhizobiales bacterium GAS188]SEE96732.1 hypothetical protein SAMN05444161_8204 [Rhizobiales bacterium GAS191]
MSAIRTTHDSPSSWREERNRRSLARLMKALPAVFPAPVLARAVSRPFVPPMPRLAIDGYWRAHPLRADRLARALAAKSGAPQGWSWRIGETAAPGLPQSFRAPPAPYREAGFALGKGHCCVCGQKVYRFGWHDDLWGAGPNRNAEWHAACVVAWRFWNAPSDQAQLLKRLQKRRCAESGKRLWRSAEVDHKLPLFQVWREHRDTPWPQLLGFWGVPNLQVINRDAHAQKCAAEAKSRRKPAKTREAFKTPEAFLPQDAFWPTVRHLIESLEQAQVEAPS